VKKLIILALSILGFILVAAPTAVEYHPVFLNGNLIGNAANFNGIIAVRLDDFAKLGGGTLTLEEAGLTLTGNTLKISSAVADDYKHKADAQAKIKINEASSLKMQPPAYKESPAYKENSALAKVNVKGESHVAWKWQRDGVITTRAFKSGGGVWIPLADIVHAFGGGVYTPGNLAPGQAIQLNFTKTPNAILIGL
jgi:hypothetical protein